MRAELSRLRNEQPKGGDVTGLGFTTLPGEEPGQFKPAPSPATSPGPQDVREALLAAKRTLAAYQKQGAPHAFVGDISLQKVYALIDAALAQSDAQPVGVERLPDLTFWYRNYRGEISQRRVIIRNLRWVSNEYHLKPQWLLFAYDMDKEAEREFAVKDMAPTRDALKSGPQPVGWQYRFSKNEDGIWGEWIPIKKHLVAEYEACSQRMPKRYEVRSLYTALHRPDASEIEQLKAELRNTWQRLETAQASEEGWKKRCQFVEAERDEAKASRPDASGLIEAAREVEKRAYELLLMGDKAHHGFGNKPVKELTKREHYQGVEDEVRSIMRMLYARAADRSAPRSDRGGA